MAQKLMLRAEVHARALRASQNVKGAVVWVGARCALRVGGSAGTKPYILCCRSLLIILVAANYPAGGHWTWPIMYTRK